MESNPRVDLVVKYHLLAFNVVVFTAITSQHPIRGKKITENRARLAREYVAHFAVPTTGAELNNHPSYRSEMQELYRKNFPVWSRHFDVFSCVLDRKMQDDLDRELFKPQNHDLRDELDMINIPARQISRQTGQVGFSTDERTLFEKFRQWLRELADFRSPILWAMQYVEDWLIEFAAWLLPSLIQLINDVPSVVNMVIESGSRAQTIILETIPQLRVIPYFILNLRIPDAFGSSRSVIEIMLVLASRKKSDIPSRRSYNSAMGLAHSLRQ
ncbi:hypothetical protein OPT61_g8174 [Boeremia exigua]|uniref:Uncharacterized protein n=1 Tax=Boeremia exigua TaxID=749465 RepID=A0ACC2HZD2_9PLEO|nr:hypothetical protein OPT61_g8174 [Boeremia exigua]